MFRPKTLAQMKGYVPRHPNRRCRRQPRGIFRQKAANRKLLVSVRLVRGGGVVASPLQQIVPRLESQEFPSVLPIHLEEQVAQEDATLLLKLCPRVDVQMLIGHHEGTCHTHLGEDMFAERREELQTSDRATWSRAHVHPLL